MKIALFLLAISFVLAAEAGRKATIPVDGILKVVNTSTSSVTFNYTCKDSAGTPIGLLTANSQVLVPGGTQTILNAGSGGSCGVGWSEATITGALPTMKRCTSSPVPFASAQTNACATNWQMCTLAEVIAQHGTATGSMPGGAFQVSGTWSYYNGSTWTDYTGNTTDYGITKFDTSASGKFGLGASGAGGNFPDMGWTQPIANSIGEVLCCQIGGNPTLCEIDITSAAGHLSSPNFLGGKAF